MVSEGFSLKEISEYLGIPYSTSSDNYKARDTVKQALGMSYTQARSEKVGKRMLELIGMGYYSFSKIATYFKGMDAVEVFQFFRSKNFELGNDYLKGYISSVILTLEKGGKDITYRAIYEAMGLDFKSESTLIDFMRENMKVITKLNRDYLIGNLAFYASKLIVRTRNGYNLLKKLGFDDGINQGDLIEIGRRMNEIFGTSFKVAKIFYRTKYLL